jgi:hypothetical protein
MRRQSERLQRVCLRQMCVKLRLSALRETLNSETRSGELQTVRLKFKLFLLLATMQIGCVPLFGAALPTR